jgi:3-oxoacyl-[acyl-carrier protein] reductase
MFDLSEKIALVTGASRGIGKSISMILAQNGAHVICVSRNIDDVQSVANIITDQKFIATAESCDISDSNNVTELVKKIIEKHGRIDILINNAGITRDNLLMRMSDDDWNEVINVNLKAAFTAIKASSRTMIKQRSGRIINISSVVGLIGNAGQANYAASKAGLIGMTKSIARELSSRGITANCIAPGYVETEMTNKLADEVKSSLNEQIPLGRIGSVEDIAYAVAFLASDEASYITGQTLAVDGGIVM